MRFVFALAALAATWQTFGPAAAITLQTFAPCQDLSPHCPALCASCSDAEKWPAGSHESYELDSAEISRPHSVALVRPNATRPTGAHRSKRYAHNGGRQWFQLPSDKPGWLPSWVPWWYVPHPGGHGGNGPNVKPGGAPGGPEGPSGGHSGGHSGGKPERKDCGDLVNGSRQLIEAFCPRSCGRCGRSTNALTAAKAYVTAQCVVAKEPSVGLSVHAQ